jgi:hypothetical protein
MARRSALREPGEVVVEAGVDHAIRQGGSPAQAVQVLQVSPVHFGAGGQQGAGTLLGPGKTQHPVPSPDQVRDDGGTEKAGRAGDKNTHLFSFNAVASVGLRTMGGRAVARRARNPITREADRPDP